jgi:hypothetical protein
MRGSGALNETCGFEEGSGFLFFSKIDMAAD